MHVPGGYRPIFSHRFQNRVGFFLLICVSFFTIQSNAQTTGQPRIDSLLTVLKSAKEDTARVSLLIDLSFSSCEINPDAGLTYGTQALALAQKLKFKKGIAWAIMRIGVNYRNKKQSSKAIEYYNRSIPLFEALKDKTGLGKTYRNMGYAWWDSMMLGESLTYFLKANEIFEQINLPVLRSNQLDIATVYRDLGEYTKAMDYLKRVLKNDQDAGDKQLILSTSMEMAHLYYMLGNDAEFFKLFSDNYHAAVALKDTFSTLWCLERMGEYYDRNGQFENLKKLTLESITLAEKYSDRSMLLLAYSQANGINKREGNYAAAMDYILKSLAIDRETHATMDFSQQYAAMAVLLVQAANDSSGKHKNFYSGNRKRMLQDAKVYADSALIIGQQLKDPRLIQDAYKQISAIEKGLGNFEAGMVSLQHYIDYGDSLTRRENNGKLGETAIQFGLDKKAAVAKVEEENTKAIQKNIRNGIAIGLAAALVFLIYIFRQRNKINKEKKRSDALLLNILPAEVADELKSKGRAEARQFDEVTVMFTDFKGFTRIAEQLPASELVAVLNTLFKAFDEIATRHGLEKIKTIGDSYMCAGGLPVSNRTHAVDVVKAGKEIRQFMADYFAQRLSENKPAFGIRIGIHTGPVVAGIVGIKKFAYDIWGDTVNTASRMESSGEPGKVNISGATYEIVKNNFRCTHRGKIQAKNKGEVDMYFVEEEL
jgi:adenylate cyclase